MDSIFQVYSYHVRIQRKGQGVWTPAKNHKDKGFLSNTGPDPLQNHKATKPAFNVGPPSAHQRNAKCHLNGISLAADDGPLIVVFGSSLPSSNKKKTYGKSCISSDSKK